MLDDRRLLAEVAAVRQELLGAFGALPEAAREAVLERYEARYGRPARLYVERMAD